MSKKWVPLYSFTLIQSRELISIGNYCHISSFASITGGGPFSIGEFSGLSSGCRVITATDDLQFHGFGNPTIPKEYRNVKVAPVTIEDFAIIGTNSVILPGVTIGKGASVGAGSIVTKDLEPWGIYIGNRKIGNRDKEGVMRNYEHFMRHKA